MASATTDKGEEASIDLLHSLDFSSIEDLDPSLADGFRVVYDREVPIEIRIQDTIDGPQQIGNVETFKVKVLLLGEDENPQSVRVELSSEADLFFLYVHELDEQGFAVVQEEQKLMVEFQDYANALIKMMNSCMKEPAQHLTIFVMQADGTGRIDFIQNLEFKYVELMTCNFVKCEEELIQQHITYRYNAVKGRLALVKSRLQDVSHLIKHKNPSLLLQLQKSPNVTVVSGLQTPTYAKQAAQTTTGRRAGDAF